MPVFQFRLQTLLDRRNEEKQHAEEVLAERERELAVEQQTMKELEEEVERVASLYQRNRAERFTAGVREGSMVTNQSDLLSGLKLDLQAAQSGVFSQQVFVDQAREGVREVQEALQVCRREVDVLDKYREQDEIGNVMHLSRRSRT
jgi:flagellar biosynthesis chaperone FliJ